MQSTDTFTGLTEGNGHTRGTVTTDADLVAMSKIGKIIARLDEQSKSRVLRYIAEKYEDYLNV